MCKACEERNQVAKVGWSGGTGIFDRIVESIKDIVYLAEVSADIDPQDIYREIIDALTDHDWDNACESEYWSHPVIGPLLGNEEIDGS
jgi:hypothetical protein